MNFEKGRISGYINVISSYTGASSDFDSATKIAKMMVTRFGMSEKVGELNRMIKRKAC